MMNMNEMLGNEGEAPSAATSLRAIVEAKNIAATTNEHTGALVGVTAGDPVAVKPVNRGRNLSSGTPAGIGAAARTVSGCINLISLVGSLSGNHYLPLWEMTITPLS